MAQETGPRGVHFVGSIKAAGPEEAMRRALDGIGDLPLQSLPDGETGYREWWVGVDINKQRQNPDMELLWDGDSSSYQNTPRFGVRPGRQLRPESLGLAYASYVPDSWEIFDRLRSEYGRDDMAFQVGMPSPTDLGFCILGEEGLKHLGVFNEATNGQIREIQRLLGDRAAQTVVQLESPTLLGLSLAREHAGAQLDPVVRNAARHIAQVADDAAPDTRIGLHLCLGDMNHRTHDDQPLTSGTAVNRAVHAALEAWPGGAALPEYVHFPVAGGQDPARLDQEIYDGLRGLRDVPPEVRLIAGIAHEKGMDADPAGPLLDDQLRVLDKVEAAVGRRVDIATACGMARGRTVQDVENAIHRMGQLARA